MIPYDEILDKAERILKNTEQLILVYCRSGRRSKLAATWIVTYGDKVLSEDEYSLILHRSDGRYSIRVSYYPHQLNNVVSVTCKDANGIVLL